MKINYLIFILSICFLFIISIILPGLLFPGDVVNNIPSYSINYWQKPKNSLLADPVFQFEPWRLFAKERILQGEFPFWNDQNGAGSPFIANPQAAVLFPLNYFYYLFPIKISLWFIPLMKLYFYSVFIYLYLRIIKVNKLSSFLGTIVAVFSGFPVVWLLWPQTNVYILFPIILYITEKLFLHKQYLHRWYISLAIVYFVGILGGHPETIFIISFIHLIYVFYRFWAMKKEIIPIFISIFSGILLGAIQIIPFIEYLLNSYALKSRSLTLTSFLPVKSMIMNFIPFILGAPQTDYYKPIESYTNFQETIGGYVGIAVLIFVISRLIYSKRDELINIWILIAGFSLIFSYKILPLSIISIIPFFNINANSRFIAFFGFGISMLFAIFINRLQSENYIRRFNEKLILIITSVSLVLIIAFGFIAKLYLKSSTERLQYFIPYLQNHLLLLLFSSAIFFYLLIRAYSTSKQKRTSYIALLIIPILMQNLLLLWNYNPVTNILKYYPSSELVNILRKLPSGRILEVGNLALPPDINLIYGLQNIENNDSIQIFDYKNSFDKAFPIKNQWGNVDDVNDAALRRFGVKYVISDYNLNYQKQNLQGKYEKILSPITKNSPIELEFTPLFKNLKDIRLMTANFNRSNTCTLKFTLFENKDKIAASNFSCKDIRDYSYYTFKLPKVLLKTNNNYYLKIESPDATNSNSIALWGTETGIPYAQLFYGPGKNNIYKQLYNYKSVYLFEVPGFNIINSDIKYTNLIVKPETISILTDNQRSGEIEIKYTYFPGWSVFIDGFKQKLINTYPFMAVKIPSGNHIVIFKYIPYSFYIGLSISLLVFVLLFIYLVRREKKQKIWINLGKELESLSVNIRKNVKWWQHGIIFIISFSLSCLSYVLIMKKLNLHFMMPVTSVINWHTVHSYPKQQDYFYFATGFSFVIIFTILLGSIWLWIKNKK